MRNIARFALALVLLSALVVGAYATGGQEPAAKGQFTYKQMASYAAPVAIKAQADFARLKYVKGKVPTIAYMPPATEFNYYIAIGEGIKAIAKDMGASTFMLAPQSGSDINGQMGMIQDVITRGVDVIILSTHDEHAAAPLVKQAVDKGIEVIIVNSDILDFPTPVHGVVGYSQRHGTQKEGQYAQKLMGDKQVIVGLIEGQPGLPLHGAGRRIRRRHLQAPQFQDRGEPSWRLERRRREQGRPGHAAGASLTSSSSSRRTTTRSWACRKRRALSGARIWFSSETMGTPRASRRSMRAT